MSSYLTQDILSSLMPFTSSSTLKLLESYLAGKTRIERVTYALTVRCSTTELYANKTCVVSIVLTNAYSEATELRGCPYSFTQYLVANVGIEPP